MGSESEKLLSIISGIVGIGETDTLQAMTALAGDRQGTALNTKFPASPLNLSTLSLQNGLGTL
ncbi:hypothetical protein NG796_14465 [Laspinema sp. A4]|uniref:hypothetical protein n=1 Tax=Laspinema sp. D2d TaxID=2953686 RepID=UPI0021BBA748|nr:hypothetical protein [Laspinema sp. D2d]MCT7984502.1 hypothetical protein [Laspinema sp. D2d]